MEWRIRDRTLSGAGIAFAAGLLEYLMTDGQSGWAPLIAGTVGVVLGPIIIAPISRFLDRRAKQARYNMPIQRAIEHILSQNPSTYESRLNAEMNAFDGIYELACSGEIRMAGALAEGVPPAPIPIPTLKELVPVDMVLPRSKEAPEGHVYALASKPTEATIRNYRNLLVVRRDLHKHWPRPKG